jgi:hypothetical protein
MIQGIVLCGLGVLTFGLGLKQFWDMKKVEPSVEEYKEIEVKSSEEIAPLEGGNNGEVK